MNTPSPLNRSSGLPLRAEQEKLVHPNMGVVKTRSRVEKFVKENAFDKLHNPSRCQSGMLSDSYHLPLLTSTSESNAPASDNDAAVFAYPIETDYTDTPTFQFVYRVLAEIGGGA